MIRAERALRELVAAFVTGRLEFWPFHHQFIDRVVRMPERWSTFLQQPAWREAYLWVCRSQPDPLRPEDRAAGLLGAEELRARLVELLPAGREE